MTLVKRTARLKEHAPLGQATAIPSERYLKNTDGSLKPDAFKVLISDDGFISSDRNKPSSDQSVYCVGDSFMESIFAHEETRFVKQVDQRLVVKVQNSGYSGMTTLHALTLISLKLPLIASKGDWIILCPGHSDAYALSKENGLWATSKYYAPISPEPLTSKWTSDISDLSVLLTTILTLCQGLGFNLGIAIAPERTGNFSTDIWLRRKYGRDRAQYIEMQDVRRYVREVTREFCTNNQIPYVDFHEEMGDDPELFYDESHLNSAGQDRAAEILENYFKSTLGLG